MAMAGAAYAQYGVVPNDRENTAGTAGFLYMVTTGRTYQYIINANQLTNLVGLQINGLQWRLLPSATTNWPPTNDANFANFDIYMGPGVDPASRTTNLATNFTGGVTQVRSGALTIPAGSFQATGTPRVWGYNIEFTPYMYTGGNLVIEVRHSGMTGNTTTVSFDAVGTAVQGYGTDYASYWTSSYTGTTGTQANFFITRLNAVPEPSTMAAVAAGVLLLVSRRRRK